MTPRKFSALCAALCIFGGASFAAAFGCGDPSSISWYSEQSDFLVMTRKPRERSSPYTPTIYQWQPGWYASWFTEGLSSYNNGQGMLGVQGILAEKDITFQLLEHPPIQDIKYVVFILAGTQLGDGNPQQITSQPDNFHNDFNGGTTHWFGLDARTLARKFVRGHGFPHWKTLVLNVYDMGIPLATLHPVNKEALIRGFKTFVQGKVNWSQIEGVGLFGMSRGGGYGMRLLANHIQYWTPPTTKFIIALNDSQFDDTESIDGLGNAYTYSSDSLQQYNPLPLNQQAFPENMACHKTEMDKWLHRYPRENICFSHNIGGEKVGTEGHRAFCDVETNTSIQGDVPYADWSNFDTVHGPDKQVFLKLDSNGHPWYKHRWVPWSHCQIGRNLGWGLVDANLAHFRNCVNYFWPEYGVTECNSAESQFHCGGPNQEFVFCNWQSAQQEFGNCNGQVNGPWNYCRPCTPTNVSVIPTLFNKPKLPRVPRGKCTKWGEWSECQPKKNDNDSCVIKRKCEPVDLPVDPEAVTFIDPKDDSNPGPQWLPLAYNQKSRDPKAPEPLYGLGFEDENANLRDKIPPPATGMYFHDDSGLIVDKEELQNGSLSWEDGVLYETKPCPCKEEPAQPEGDVRGQIEFSKEQLAELEKLEEQERIEEEWHLKSEEPETTWYSQDIDETALTKRA